MAVEEIILECVRTLPPSQQEKVREFAEQLRQQSQPAVPLKSLEGLWSRYSFDLTDEDITEARREMWGTFPREDIVP